MHWCCHWAQPVDIASSYVHLHWTGSHWSLWFWGLAAAEYAAVKTWTAKPHSASLPQHLELHSKEWTGPFPVLTRKSLYCRQWTRIQPRQEKILSLKVKFLHYMPLRVSLLLLLHYPLLNVLTFLSNFPKRLWWAESQYSFQYWWYRVVVLEIASGCGRQPYSM